MHSGAKRSLLAALVLAAVLGHVLDLLDFRGKAYYAGIAVDIAIAVILAVSLNLINGHAGFMAVGAYAAASLTLAAGRRTPVWSAGCASMRGITGGFNKLWTLGARASAHFDVE